VAGARREEGSGGDRWHHT